jgi:Sec-independent protein translocase protein TatA
MDDMQDVMQSLNESRMQLEMLARWPQMLKDMDRQLTMLGRDLKKAKATADKLIKKGVDVGSVLSKFEESVNKLKVVRDEADKKVKAGEAEDAMEMVQDEFFGQMEDVMDGRKIIEMMSNLGRFNSEFKRGVAQAEAEIKRLARRKLDVAELKTLLEEIKQKGQGVMDLLKGGDIDEEEVMSVMQEMEDMRQKFEEEIAELTGEEETQPWEKGTQQFKAIPVAPEMSKFMKRDSAEGSGERQIAP